MSFAGTLSVWRSKKKDGDFTDLIKRICFFLVRRGAVVEQDLEFQTCLSWSDYMSFQSTLAFLESQNILGYEIDDYYNDGREHKIWHAALPALRITSTLSLEEELLLKVKYGV